MRWSAIVLLVCAHIASAQPAGRSAAAHRRQAKVYVAKHQIDLAIKELELAVEQAPDPDTLFELAQLYDQVPDEAKALASYQRITEGKHLAAAQARMAAIFAAREQRDAEAKLRAEAEAKAKAEEEARQRAADAAEAARKADEARRHAEDEDRQRRSTDADRLEARTRELAEQRHRDARIGTARADWIRDREIRGDRRARGVRYLKIGIVCGAVAGAAAAIGAIETSRIENGGFSTASNISFALTTGHVANYVAYGFGIPAVIGIAAGVPLFVLGRPRGELRVSAVATGAMQGLALSGQFR
jgi:tetratricopeptide (TPR) repeat protein